MKRLTLIVALAAQCIGASLAHADSMSSPPARRLVQFDDLDLTQNESVATLYGRLHSAAGEVCSLPDERRLERGRMFRACVADAVAAAVISIDKPPLTAYHRAKAEGRELLSAGRPR